MKKLKRGYKMEDVIDEIAFPLGIVAFVMSWTTIAIGKESMIDIFFLFFGFTVMFLFNPNRRSKK